MLIRKLRKHLSEALLEAGYFRNKMYPTFVTDSSPELIKGEIPVFVYHSIEPKVFEEQLEFLSLNGYHTTTTEEFYDFLIGQKRPREKSVLLTIDDGRSSVWTFAYPLLMKYGFKATVFLIPGYTKEAVTYHPNLEDYWSGKVSLEEVVDRDKSDDPLLNWDEISKMHESGLIDFQSHSLYHHKIFTKPEIVDFFNPSCDQALYDLVLPYSGEDGFCYNKREKLFGMPIYTHNSLMSGESRYFDDEALRSDCVNYVSRNGGRDFFRHRGWRKTLLKRVEEYKRQYGLKDCTATSKERDQEILDNLIKSRKLIEERLNKKMVRHFCFPYGIGSALCTNLSKSAGYLANFWSCIVGRRNNIPGDDPFYCVRLKNDFIFRLPGNGRKSLVEIIKFKFRRRLSGELVY
jgi:hypothetical protein